MYDDLLNKTALVCGSTQGIGLSIAKNFAENGVNLILVSRDKLKLQKIISTDFSDISERGKNWTL